MRYIYTVIIDNDEAVSCPSMKIAKKFILDFQRMNNEPVHKFSIYNTESGISKEIKIKERNTMKKEELFEKAVKAMDSYTEAIKMDLLEFADYFDAEMRKYTKEIKRRGLAEEFEEFALIF